MERDNRQPLPRPSLPPGWRNLRVTLSYHGGAFRGYQFQPHVPSVQGALQEAWSVVARDPQGTLMGCSRLDAGVCAYHYVLTVHTSSSLPCDALVASLNGYFQSGTPAAIRIASVEDVDPHFHARFDALAKHYRYLLWYGHGQHALLGPRAWRVRSAVPLVVGDLAPLWSQYVGTHDFRGFRSADCTAKTTRRTVYKSLCWPHPLYPNLFILDVWGDGFLKNMVRTMVGTAVDVALGKLPPDTIEKAFHHGSRAQVGQCAPGLGLTLMQVFYRTEDLELSLHAHPLAPF